MGQNLWPAIIGAATGGGVSILGWFALHVLSARRESTSRREAAAVEHLERQISELYGPLLGLIQNGKLCYELAKKVLTGNANADRIAFDKLSEEQIRVWRFFVEQYFIPTNARIRDLVREKMHLLKDGGLPPSFEDFLRHQVQLEALHTLWREAGTDASSVTGHGWPKDFENEVSKTLGSLQDQHKGYLARFQRR